MADGSGASTLHLAALSLVGADPPATTADDLPRELWESILAAIVMDDPRNEVRKLPAVRKEWARWFRDGTLYEAANCRLGWYGDLPSLEAVQANVARRSDFPIWVPPATPKAYFQQACQAMCEAKRVYDVAHPGLDRFAETRYLERPYFAKIAEEILMCVSDFITKVPTNHPAFDQLARFLVEQSGTLNSPLMYIPTDCANYGELAKIVVQNHEDALQNVPEDRADYAEIAKLAVQHEGWALQYVPPNRADYGELAMFAVQNNGYAINDVPTGRDDYGELARHAVQQEGQALQDVPSNRPDYGELAKLAVQQVAKRCSKCPRIAPTTARLLALQWSTAIVILLARTRTHCRGCPRTSPTTASSRGSPCRTTAWRCSTCPQTASATANSLCSPCRMTAWRCSTCP